MLKFFTLPNLFQTSWTVAISLIAGIDPAHLGGFSELSGVVEAFELVELWRATHSKKSLFVMFGVRKFSLRTAGHVERAR